MPFLRRRKQVLAQAAATAMAGLALIGRSNAEPIGSAAMYANDKYGYSLVLPSDVFDPATARRLEEGALWASRDGAAHLLVVAGPNETSASLQDYRRSVLEQSYPAAKLDYAPLRQNWFVLSGTKDGLVFYERVTFACEGRYIYGWQLTYPIAARGRYDAVVEAIHRSYRMGRGEDGRCGRVSRRGSTGLDAQP